MISFILEVLLLAIVIAFLGAWGIVKNKNKSQELLENLFRKSERKIIKDMKKGQYYSKQDLESMIRGVRASLFWSKYTIKVENAHNFIDNVIQRLIDKNLLISKRGKYKLNDL